MKTKTQTKTDREWEVKKKWKKAARQQIKTAHKRDFPTPSPNGLPSSAKPVSSSESQRNNSPPKSSQATKSPSVYSKPSTPATQSPFAATQTANGSSPDRRYYLYELHADGDTDNSYLESVVADLCGKSYPNLGDMYLAIAAKFVGMRQVSEFLLRWRQDVFRVDVVVKLVGWNEAKCVAWFQPTDQWYLTDTAGKEVQRFVPKPYTTPPTAKPLDPGLLAATKPVKGEELDQIDKLLVATKPKEKPKVVLGVELTKSKKGKTLIFGHHVTAVVRWCGWDAWAIMDVYRLLAGLGLGEAVKAATVEEHMKWGRSKADHLPTPKLTQGQENALLAVVEKLTVKPAKKKR